MNLHQGIPRVDDWHGGGNSRPPGAQALVTPEPGGHTGDATPCGPEGTRALGGEAPINAPHGSRGGCLFTIYLLEPLI